MNTVDTKQIGEEIELTRRRSAELAEQIKAAHVRMDRLRHPTGPTEAQQEVWEELQNSHEELRVAEEQMRQQNEHLAAALAMVDAERRRYQDLFEFAPEAYLVTDAGGVIREANAAAVHLFKVRHGFLIGKPVAQFVPAKERRAFRVEWARRQLTLTLWDWELRLEPRDGLTIEAAVTIAPVRNAHQHPASWRWLVRDITRHQDILREHQERYRLLAEGMPQFVWTGWPDGSVDYCNPWLLEYTGLAREQCTGRGWTVALHPDDFQAATERSQRAPNPTEPFEFEARFRRRSDGSYRWHLVRMAPLRRADGLIVKWIGIGIDIDDRKRIQNERASDQERLAEHEREAAVLQERNRLAREIHDTLAQGFTGIALQLEAAEDVLMESPEQAQIHLARARQLARDSLAEARRSVQALRPQALEDGDLPDAFRAMVAQFTAHPRKTVTFTVHGTEKSLPSFVESELLRIGQEALTNALRHAQADRIVIELTYGARQVRLRVHDNGSGFHLGTAATGGGFGLTSMCERSERIGGKCRITSRPGQGTEVLVSLPAPDRPPSPRRPASDHGARVPIDGPATAADGHS